MSNVVSFPRPDHQDSGKKRPQNKPNEHGYLRACNDVVTARWGKLLSRDERTLVLFVLGRTLRFNNSHEKIPMRHFIDGVTDAATGVLINSPVGFSERHISNLLRALTAKKILISTRSYRGRGSKPDMSIDLELTANELANNIILYEKTEEDRKIRLAERRARRILDEKSSYYDLHKTANNKNIVLEDRHRVLVGTGTGCLLGPAQGACQYNIDNILLSIERETIEREPPEDRLRLTPGAVNGGIEMKDNSKNNIRLRKQNPILRAALQHTATTANSDVTNIRKREEDHSLKIEKISGVVSAAKMKTQEGKAARRRKVTVNSVFETWVDAVREFYPRHPVAARTIKVEAMLKQLIKASDNNTGFDVFRFVREIVENWPRVISRLNRTKTYCPDHPDIITVCKSKLELFDLFSQFSEIERHRKDDLEFSKQNELDAAEAKIRDAKVFIRDLRGNQQRAVQDLNDGYLDEISTLRAALAEAEKKRDENFMALVDAGVIDLSKKIVLPDWPEEHADAEYDDGSNDTFEG